MRTEARRRWRSTWTTAGMRQTSRGRPPRTAASAGCSSLDHPSCPTASASYRSPRPPKPHSAPGRPAPARAASVLAMRIGVVGGGLMGSGIAEVCARAGVDVTVVEADQDRVERSRASIEKSLDRAVRGGKLEQPERDAAFERLAFSAALGDLEGSDAAIEAIVE